MAPRKRILSSVTSINNNLTNKKRRNIIASLETNEDENNGIIDLQNNRLKNIDGLKGIKDIKQLHLNNNHLLRITFLPPSLVGLTANVSQLVHFDFKSLPNLKLLRSNSTDRSKFCNLP